MIGAESLLHTLLAGGIDTCFMNPGTSEMQFVAALDRVSGMRGVLCLFEGVCAGAADGYARMLRRPAATLLHLGPGLGNALSNLHNARKARSPVVNIVGQHSTWHLRHDAPLTADIEAFARPASDWVRTVARVAEVGADAATAIQASRTPPGRVATLIVPADFSWSEAGEPFVPSAPPARSAPSSECIRAAAKVLRSGEPAALLLGGGTLFGEALTWAARLAAGTGVRVYANRYSARLEGGAGKFVPQRIPYFPEAAETVLAGLRHLILVESMPPVSFFGYPGRRSDLAPEDCTLHVLAPVEQDGTAALRALAEECGVASAITTSSQQPRPCLPAGAALTPETIGQALAVLLPEDAIVADEMVSSAEPVSRHMAAAQSFDVLPVTGGSIGQGLPVAVGAAVACPGRTVVALEADGSGMYTLQALWTMARERLDVVTVIFANRRYRILDIEMQRTGSGAVGPQADRMIDIASPALDWVKLAQGAGVEAVRAATADEFIAAFRTAVRERGPRLIEAVLEG
jgi:acetolactate synthase-1/2/3 large subunit